MTEQTLTDPAEIAFLAAWRAANPYRPGAKELLPLADAAGLLIPSQKERGRIGQLGQWLGARREVVLRAPGVEYLIRDGQVLDGRQRWALITKAHSTED